MSDLNDPRVFFSAERTLMAWNRTGVTLMAFGFMLERFGLFIEMLRPSSSHVGRDLSFWVGAAFIVLALVVMSYAVVQYRRVVKTLKPIEIPAHYSTWVGVAMSLSVVVLGMALLMYLFLDVSI